MISRDKVHNLNGTLYILGLKFVGLGLFRQSDLNNYWIHQLECETYFLEARKSPKHEIYDT